MNTCDKNKKERNAKREVHVKDFLSTEKKQNIK